MVLRMKNFNILGVHWKIRLLGGKGLTKNQYTGGYCLKRGHGQFVGLRRAWQEKGGWWFWGGVDTPMHTMMSLGNKQILTFKISVTNFCRFRYFADFDIKIVPSGQNTVKPLNSGYLRFLKNCPLLRGVRYWEVI